MHGGYRVSAGRKPGFSAKNAEEARRYLAQRVSDELAPITDALLKMAKNGDIRAIQVLFDRAWGKSRQEVAFVMQDIEPESSPEIIELTHRLNAELGSHPL